MAVYERCLESMDSYLSKFAKTYDLQDPFVEGRLQQMRQTLEMELSNYI